MQNAWGTSECINILDGKHGYKGRKDRKNSEAGSVVLDWTYLAQDIDQ